LQNKEKPLTSEQIKYNINKLKEKLAVCGTIFFYIAGKSE